MKYCTKCLQADTRPNTYFNEQGVCPACEYYETLKDVDWDEREEQLQDIVAFAKEHNQSGYDCIIGVSGGKDSVRQSLYIKEHLKMNPLLVCLGYPPEQVSERGVDNISNLIELGFDCIVINPSPKTWQYNVKKSFFKFSNWCKSTELALFSSVPRLAIAYQIPVIWWGENPALQLGDMKALGKHGGDGNNLKHTSTLAGGDLSWLIDENIKENQLLQYKYPLDREMEKANLKIIYLGYYWKDWSLVDNAKYSCVRGLDVRENEPEINGDLYGVTALDEDWVTFNQMIKYYKFGFGRISDYLNEELRKKNISREEAIKIAKKYDGVCDSKYIQSFCDYLEISMEQFWEVIDKNVNKDLFERGNEQKRWIPKFEVGVGL